MVVQFNLKNKKGQSLFTLDFELEKKEFKGEKRVYLKQKDNNLDKISEHEKELYFTLNDQQYMLLNLKWEKDFHFNYSFVKDIIRCYKEDIQILYYDPSFRIKDITAYSFLKKSKYNKSWEKYLFNEKNIIIIDYTKDKFEKEEEKEEYLKTIGILIEVSRLLCQENHRDKLIMEKTEGSIREPGAYIINKGNYLNFFISLITKNLNIEYGANKCIIGRDYYMGNVNEFTFK